MRKIRLSMGLIIICIIGSYSFRLLPIVVQSSNIVLRSGKVNLKEGNEIKLFNDFDFNTGNYSLYIVFSRSEGKEQGHSKVLFTNKKNVLNRLQKAFVLRYTGGDMTTCESTLYLLKGKKIVFKSGMTIENNAGLQSEEYGWLEFTDKQKILNSLKTLSAKYTPYIRL